MISEDKVPAVMTVKYKLEILAYLIRQCELPLKDSDGNELPLDPRMVREKRQLVAMYESLKGYLNSESSTAITS